jgi:hypothetical protein
MRLLRLEHPRPRTSILHSGLNSDVQLLGNLDGEVNVSEQFPSEENDVRFVPLEDLVGLYRLGDEADSSDL